MDPAEAPPSGGVMCGDVFTPAFDAAFAGIMTKPKKYLHCLQHIDEHGESEFLINCFGVFSSTASESPVRMAAGASRRVEKLRPPSCFYTICIGSSSPSDTSRLPTQVASKLCLVSRSIQSS